VKADGPAQGRYKRSRSHRRTQANGLLSESLNRVYSYARVEYPLRNSLSIATTKQAVHDGATL
jgi:hypothetical protein